MFFQRVKTPGIAHNAYMIGSDGVAAVIDPRRDVEEYLEIARLQGLSIRYVLETHRQEDFALGSLCLKRATGAVIVGGTAVYLVLDSPQDLDDTVSSLARIGIDRIEGVLAKGFDAWRNAGLPIASAGTIDPRGLEDRLGKVAVLDVREITEFEAGHIPAARHIYVGDLVLRGPDDLGLDPNQPVVVTCSVGHRASLGVSVLQRHGYRSVSNLLGGMTAWTKLGLATDGRG